VRWRKEKDCLKARGQIAQTKKPEIKLKHVKKQALGEEFDGEGQTAIHLLESHSFRRKE